MSTLDVPVAVQLVAVLTGGMFIGSFLNTFIYRIPIIAEANQAPVGAQAPRFDMLRPKRSVCPSCKRVIPLRQNFPILSWLLLRGRAGCCGAQIPVRYFVVEILGALVALVAWGIHGATWSLVPFALFCYTMLIVAVVDLETHTAPNVLTYPLIAMGFLVATFGSVSPINTKDSIYGAVCGGLCIWLVRYLHQLIRGRVGLGTGDILVITALGAWLGYRALVPATVLGFAIALLCALWLIVLHRRKLVDTLPLGPFLTFGAICVLVTRDLGYLPSIFST